MAKIPNPDSPSVQAIYQAYENEHRNTARLQRRLGASSIGHCPRRSWYDFRWAHCVSDAPSGRVLRLFDTGHRAEERFVKDLRAIGCEVHDRNPATGEQWEFTALDGHLVVKLDAAVLRLPESPTHWHAAEFKTHSAKSFKEVQAKGVREAKPEHYAQLLLGMHLSGMDRAFYLAVNKDTDELYSERFHLCAEEAAALMTLAEQIIRNPQAPPRPFDGPEKYPCIVCPHRAMCWGTVAPSPAVCCRVTCRSCCHATAAEGGMWKCERKGVPLAEPEQRAACGDHLFLPDFLAFAKIEDAEPDINCIRYTLADGTRFSQGNGKPSAIRSRELQQLPHAMLGLPTQGLAGKIREAFPGAEVRDIE